MCGRGVTARPTLLGWWCPGLGPPPMAAPLGTGTPPPPPGPNPQTLETLESSTFQTARQPLTCPPIPLRWDRLVEAGASGTCRSSSSSTEGPAGGRSPPRVALLLPLEVVRELDGLKKCLFRGHWARKAVKQLLAMQGQTLLRGQRWVARPASLPLRVSVGACAPAAPCGWESLLLSGLLFSGASFRTRLPAGAPGPSCCPGQADASSRRPATRLVPGLPLLFSHSLHS